MPAPSSPRSRRHSAGSRAWRKPARSCVRSQEVGRQDAVEHTRRRPGHPDPVVAPVDVQRPAVELDPHAPPGQPAPVRGDGGGAGARSAGQRDARRRAPRPASGGDPARSATRTRHWCARGTGDRSRSAPPRPRHVHGFGVRRRRTRNADCPCPPPPGSPGRGRCSRSASRESGTSRQSSSGCPMFTLTCPSARRSAPSTPRSVSKVTRSRPSPRITSSATQRVALPQAPARVPSAFQKSSAKSARSASRISASWSKPTPRLPVAQRARQPRRGHRRPPP